MRGRAARTGLLAVASSVAICASVAVAQPPEAQFSSSAAEATLRGQILASHSDAVFPAVEGRLCPETYTGSEGAYSICYAEYRTGGTWHLEGGRAQLAAGRIALRMYVRTSWRRRWVRCGLAHGRDGAPGSLSSNYACGLRQVSDAYLAAVEIYPSIRRHRRVGTVGWQFTESAGFASVGDFHGRRRGSTYTFTNALGDSFRYTP